MCEISQCVLSDRPGGGEARDGPLLDLDTCEKLLAPHVPDPLIGQCLLLGPSSVLQFWRRQDTTSDLHEVVADIEAKLLDKGVIVEICLADEIVNFPLTIWSRASGGFDHGGGLHVSEFLDTSLSLDNVADLQGQVGMLVLLSDLKMIRK